MGNTASTEAVTFPQEQIEQCPFVTQTTTHSVEEEKIRQLECALNKLEAQSSQNRENSK